MSVDFYPDYIVIKFVVQFFSTEVVLSLHIQTSLAADRTCYLAFRPALWAAN
jgi:hypothetical protein